MKDKTVDQDNYHPDPNFKLGKEPEHQVGFFESLFYGKVNMQKLTPEEMERENDRNYVDGYQSPIGPIKWLSRD